MEALIGARAVAGAGGGAMMSVGSIIVTDLGKDEPFRSCAQLWTNKLVPFVSYLVPL